MCVWCHQHRMSHFGELALTLRFMFGLVSEIRSLIEVAPLERLSRLKNVFCFSTLEPALPTIPPCVSAPFFFIWPFFRRVLLLLPRQPDVLGTVVSAFTHTHTHTHARALGKANDITLWSTSWVCVCVCVSLLTYTCKVYLIDEWVLPTKWGLGLIHVQCLQYS